MRIVKWWEEDCARAHRGQPDYQTVQTSIGNLRDELAAAQDFNHLMRLRQTRGLGVEPLSGDDYWFSVGSAVAIKVNIRFNDAKYVSFRQ
jgi:hypothetical protein